MIVKVPSWLAYKLTGLSKQVRCSDYFNVLGETEKAYKIAYLGDKDDPIGYVAKSLVLESKEDDTDEIKKVEEHYNKLFEENRKDLERYEKQQKENVELKIKEREQWLKDNQVKINKLKYIENQLEVEGKEHWVGVYLGYERNIAENFGLNSVDDAIEHLMNIDLNKYSPKLSTFEIELKAIDKINGEKVGRVVPVL